MSYIIGYLMGCISTVLLIKFMVGKHREQYEEEE